MKIPLPQNLRDLLGKAWFAALCAALLSAAVYLPVLGAGFVWDDSTVQDYQLPNIHSVGQAFYPPRGMVEWADFYYRPIVVVTYLADEALTKAFMGEPQVKGGKPYNSDPRRARIPHATVLLTHMLVVVGVTLLVARLLRGKKGANAGVWAAGILFAVHAVHAEPVSTVAGRSDTLAAGFLLFAILCVLRWCDGGKAWLLALSGALYLLALFSKESAVSGIFALPLCVWCCNVAWKKKEKLRNWLFTIAPFAAAGIVYAVVRYTAHIRVPVSTRDLTGQTVWNMFRACAFYLGELFWPWEVAPFVPDLPGNVETVAMIAVGLLLLFGAYYAFRSGERAYLAAIGWFLAAVAPTMSVVAGGFSEVLVAERYLYLPSVAFALAVGFLAAKAIESARGWQTKAAATVFCVFIAGNAAVSFAATSMWQSDLALWSALTRQKMASRHALPWTNLGHTALVAGDIAEAERAYTRALKAEVPPDAEDRALAYGGIGAIRLNRASGKLNEGKLAEAAELLKEAENYHQLAVNQNIQDWTLLLNLGAVRLQRVFLEKGMTGKYNRQLLEAARRPLEEALRIEPGNRGVIEQLNRYRQYSASAQQEQR